MKVINHDISSSIFRVVCIIGPRQVGKTFFIKSIIEKLADNTVYIDLELPSDLAKLTDPQLYFEQQVGKTVIIDEVQHRVLSFRTLLNLWQDVLHSWNSSLFQ